ncbi:hypothetical protein A2U01_0118584, partial [Trifolium medium]|nr:hypothetical protein [Trifolium medium]
MRTTTKHSVNGAFLMIIL